MPVVFVSHGAPDALVNAPSAVACWKAIGEALPKPKAVLALSAHWEAMLPTVSLAAQPETLHDFAGFAREMYSLRYPAPGATDLARRVVQRFAETGTALRTAEARGLDHGAWVPLYAMFPGADIPVAQLALPHQGDAADYLTLGTLLRPLRDEGVLILASGAITHNFGWLRWGDKETANPLPRAREFADWVGERIAGRDVQGLADYRRAPYGAEAHPSEEHFMPLLAAVGAAGDDAVQRFQPAFTYGGLAMDAYVWGETLN
jgi:4,5-DOPA dioxygenase extradiol